MKAMVVKRSCFSNILEQRKVMSPEIKDNEVIIKVCAVGVNWGDIFDMVTSDDGICPGLECSGIIEAVGRNVICWKVGDKGSVPFLKEEDMQKKWLYRQTFFFRCLMINLADAAGLPYASCSIWLALFKMRDPKALRGKTVLIREGTSGIGALAIQYAKYMWD
ncbi:uncharacterized protein [Henckelia pumila]|uniref:uncharacterized protein n=1 Tax=Henckelia pumila TaxID=405737 RepID=UPI003C6DE0BB